MDGILARVQGAYEAATLRRLGNGPRDPLIGGEALVEASQGRPSVHEDAAVEELLDHRFLEVVGAALHLFQDQDRFREAALPAPAVVVRIDRPAVAKTLAPLLRLPACERTDPGEEGRQNPPRFQDPHAPVAADGESRFQDGSRGPVLSTVVGPAKEDGPVAARSNVRPPVDQPQSPRRQIQQGVVGRIAPGGDTGAVLLPQRLGAGPRPAAVAGGLTHQVAVLAEEEPETPVLQLGQGGFLAPGARGFDGDPFEPDPGLGLE